MKVSGLFCGLCLAVSLSGLVPAGAVAQQRMPLGSLDLDWMTQGWGRPRVDRSVVGKPLSVGGRVFEHGLGSHAASVLHVSLDGRAAAFTAQIGVDDETEGRGSVRFKIYGDGKAIYDSGPVKGGEEPRPIDVVLTGLRRLVLVVSDTGDGIDYDHADWCEAVFAFAGAPPRAAAPPIESREILTPGPGPAPRINGPRRTAVRPGRPLLYRIPVTGERPMAFGADGLPAGLVLDPSSGIIQGTVEDRTKRAYRVTLWAENAQGKAERELEIVVGETLAVTPPMGWNSWYIHYNRVTGAVMRGAADAMVSSGMADFGYAYVNIDDCWMVKPGSEDPRLGGEPRDEQGAIKPNGLFPDIKGMVDHIHSLGLKAGLYTSPGPRTCAGYEGSYGHEEIDARTFAAWGFDFLKYDWCSYGQVAAGEGRERLIAPYRKMAGILASLDRDIVLNLCQYGMGDVWKWGGTVGQCWRTTGDLGLAPDFITIGLANAKLSEFAGPGRWNDPDYILIGWVGDAHRQGEGRPTALTGSEQYAYMSMWCLMAAPLIFSGDISKLDPFTLNVLCNAEVIEVDQDPLGRQARIVRRTEEELVLAKEMSDGSLAVGLFNLAEVPLAMDLSWDDLGLTERQRVRDLWRQKPFDPAEHGLAASLPRHGVLLVRLWPVE